MPRRTMFKERRCRYISLAVILASVLLMIIAFATVKVFDFFLILFIFILFALALTFYYTYRIHHGQFEVSDEGVSLGRRRIHFGQLDKVVFKEFNIVLFTGIIFYFKDGRRAGVHLLNFDTNLKAARFIDSVYRLARRYNIGFFTECLGEGADLKPGTQSDLRCAKAATKGRSMYLSMFLVQALILGGFLLVVPVVLGVTDRILFDIFWAAIFVGILESPILLLLYALKIPRCFSLTKDSFCIKYLARKKCVRLDRITKVSTEYIENPVFSYGRVTLFIDKKKVEFDSEQLRNPLLIKDFITHLKIVPSLDKKAD